jgi:hypothetical protein
MTTNIYIVTPYQATDTKASRYNVRHVNTGEEQTVGYPYGATDPRKAAICDAFGIDPQDYPNGITEVGAVATRGENAYKSVYSITK